MKLNVFFGVPSLLLSIILPVCREYFSSGRRSAPEFHNHSKVKRYWQDGRASKRNQCLGSCRVVACHEYNEQYVLTEELALKKREKD